MGQIPRSMERISS